MCRQLIELWEILLGRVEAGHIAPSQWIHAAKLASSQLHHICEATWIYLAVALHRLVLFLLRHEDGRQCGWLLVVAAVPVVLLRVRVKLG